MTGQPPSVPRLDEEEPEIEPAPPPDRKPEPVPKTPEDPEKGRVPPITEPGKSEHPN